MARQRPTRIPTPHVSPRGRPRAGNGTMYDVQYQFEVNRTKDNFGWAWSMWAGAPQVEIDRIAIRDVQYQFEVNRCRNEEWAWSMWAGCPRAGNVAMHNVQYQFEVNRFRNEEIIENAILCGRGLYGRGRPMIDRIVIRDFQDLLKVNRCRNKEVNCKFQGSRDYSVGRKTEITTISPLFLRKAWE
ncbi:hypothetical protein DPMN_121336 [Dreissena polymorpha]|uniref:Uncharacterized protein n=1 Tax=Dreissena polymorpha TaxID=45954 RepID=A0A9D4GML4_DREPO|nr:hypothetical protein DPMN_121336 [Dreissena polymorpha]